MFSPKIQLGPNWKQSTTKMAVARLRCDADSSEVFHINNTNMWGQEKDSFDPLSAKQVGTGHKLHFQHKHPVRAKLVTINIKNGCGMAEVWCRQFISVSYNWYYHIRSGKRQHWPVVSPTKPAQVISSIFSPNIQLGPNCQQSTTKMDVAWLRCDGDN